MPDDPRIATRHAAAAVGMPEATLRMWLRAHRAEMTPQGYPITTVLRVLAAHGREIPRAMLEGAAATRPLRPRKDAAQSAQALTTAPEAALTAFLDALRAQQETQQAILATQKDILAELRAGARAQTAADAAQPVRREAGWRRVLRWLLRS